MISVLSVDLSQSVCAIGLILLYESLLYIICTIGDKLLNPALVPSGILRAISDSVTHGLVGFFSWAVITGLRSRADLLQCGVSFMLASIIDLDHFIAARSLKLQDALSLPSRPFFHASTIIPPMTMALWTAGEVLREQLLQTLSLIFFIAWTSHHVRDANRRGLWFPPFGETPPLSRHLYLGIVLIAPLVIKLIYDNFIVRSRFRSMNINRNASILTA